MAYVVSGVGCDVCPYAVGEYVAYGLQGPLQHHRDEHPVDGGLETVELDHVPLA